MPRDSEVPLIPPDMTPRDDADEHLSPLAAGPAVGPGPGATSSSLATEKMALERHQIHAGSGSTAAPGCDSASSWDSTLIPSRKTPAALEMNKFRGTILMRRPYLCVVDFLIVWTLFSIVYVPGLGSDTFQGYCGIPVLGTYLTLAVFDNDAAQARLRLQMQREEAAAAAEAGVDGEGAGDEDSGGSNDAAAKEYGDDKSSKGKVNHAAAGDYDFASLLSSSRRKLGGGSSDAGSTTTTTLPADNINKWSLRTSLRKNIPGGVGPLSVFGENAQMLDENQQKQELVLGHATSSASEGVHRRNRNRLVVEGRRGQTRRRPRNPVRSGLHDVFCIAMYFPSRLLGAPWNGQGAHSCGADEPVFTGRESIAEGGGKRKAPLARSRARALQRFDVDGIFLTQKRKDGSDGSSDTEDVGPRRADAGSALNAEDPTTRQQDQETQTAGAADENSDLILVPVCDVVESNDYYWPGLLVIMLAWRFFVRWGAAAKLTLLRKERAKQKQEQFLEAEQQRREKFEEPRLGVSEPLRVQQQGRRVSQTEQDSTGSSHARLREICDKQRRLTYQPRHLTWVPSLYDFSAAICTCSCPRSWLCGSRKATEASASLLARSGILLLGDEHYPLPLLRKVTSLASRWLRALSGREGCPSTSDQVQAPDINQEYIRIRSNENDGDGAVDIDPPEQVERRDVAAVAVEVEDESGDLHTRSNNYRPPEASRSTSKSSRASASPTCSRSPSAEHRDQLVGAVAQDRQWWPYGASAPIQILNGEIDLVFFGGNHVSEACALDVLDVIEQLDPDAFAIELDLKRYDSKTARQKNSALLLHESLTFSFVDGRSFASTSVAFPAAEWNVFLEEKKNKTPAALPAPAGGLAPSSKTTTASSSSGGAAGSPEVDIAFYPLTLQAALTRWADAFERGDFAAGGQASGAAFGDTDFSAGVSLADAGLPSSSQARATLRSCDAFNYSGKYVVVFNRNYAPRRVAHEFAALGAAGVILLQEEHAAIKSWWLGLAPSRVNVPLKADEQVKEAEEKQQESSTSRGLPVAVPPSPTHEAVAMPGVPTAVAIVPKKQAPRRTSVLYAPEQFSILGLVTDLLVHRGAAWRWKRGRPGIPLFVAAVPPSTSEDYTPVVDVVEDAWPQPIWAALDLQNMSQERRAFFEFVRNVVVKAPRPTTREDPLNSRPSQIIVIRVTARTNHAHTKVEADVHGQWLARTLRDAPIVSRYDYFRYTFSLYKNASGASTTATKQGNNSSPSFVFFLFPVVLLYTFTYLLGLRSGQEFVNQSKVAEYLKRPLFLVDSGDTDLGFEFRRRLCHPFQTLKTAVWFWTGVPRWLFTCLLFPMYSVDPLGVIVSTIARAPLLGVLAILLAAQFTTWLLAFAGYLLWNFLVATGLADFLISGTSSALQGNAGGAQEQMKGGATGGLTNGMNDGKAAPSAHDALNADAETPSSSFFGSTSEFGWFVVSLIAISIYVDIMLVQRNQFMSYNVLRFLEQHLGSENVERDQHVAVGVNRAVDVADGRTKKKRKLVLVGIGAMHGPGMTDLLQNETEFRHQVAVASGTVAQVRSR